MAFMWMLNLDGFCVTLSNQNEDKSRQQSIRNQEKNALCEKENHENTEEPSGLQYRINESPPIYVALFISFQHLVICFASTLTLSIIIGDTMCADPDSVLRSRLFSTALCMSGLNTIAQSLAGSRLPVFQGPSFTFITPLITLGSEPAWSCPRDSPIQPALTNNTLSNTTVLPDEIEKLTVFDKLQQLSGSLMAASAVEVAIGALGLVGPLMRRVGPITMAPTISLIGLCLYKLPIQYSRPFPLMAIASAVLVVVFSLYLQKIQISVGCGRNKARLPIFQVLPVLLSVCMVWIAAAILTACGVFSDDPKSLTYLARTDAKAGIVHATPWLLFTYPGQFGFPSFNVAAFIGFTAAVVSSVVESVGDYLAAARSCEVPPPPQHAVSRGLLIEGVGSVLSGAYGAGHATATYSGSIALLSLCRTASRSVLVIAGIILVAVSFIGKIAAAFSTVPEPILGGVFLVVIGMLVAIGISTLKHVELHSTRNLIILGVSIFTGMVVPAWMAEYPESIDTGNPEGDQVVRVALGTPMILGGVVACVLDNTVPGTLEERGMHKWVSGSSAKTTGDTLVDPEDVHLNAGCEPQEQDTYGWSWYPALLRRCRMLRYVPFLPPYSAPMKMWSLDGCDESGC